MANGRPAGCCAPRCSPLTKRGSPGGEFSVILGQAGSIGFRLACGRWLAQERSRNGRSIVGMN